MFCMERIVHERPDDQVFYVLPVESIEGWIQFLESCLSYQLATQELFHIACGSMWRTLSGLHSIQERGPVTVASDGISTRGP